MTPRAALGLSCACLVLAGFSWAPARPADFQFVLDLDQVLRSTADDSPVESQDWTRKIRAGLDVGWDAAADGPNRARLSVTRFDLRQQLGENEMAPLGADKMRGLKLLLPLDARGPAGVPALAADQGLDASAWTLVQPLSEALRHGLGLALPVIAGPASSWTVARRVPLGLPGAPALEMDVVSAYVVTGREDCGSGRCVRIAEILSAQFSDYRPLGGTLILIEVEGFGQASHLFSVDESLPLQSDGQIALSVRLHTQTVPGLPLYGTVTDLTSRYSLHR